MVPDVPKIGLAFLVDAGQVGVFEPAANLDRRCRRQPQPLEFAS